MRARHETPAALRAALSAEGLRRIRLDGGEPIPVFGREDLVDRVTVITVPVHIGQGRRVRGARSADQAWWLETARHWDCGFVQTTDERMRAAPAAA